MQHPKYKLMDLCSGIGGFSLGLERTGGFETVALCDNDPFCQKVLKKHWPDVPLYKDIKEVDHEGPVHIITGGYPCQPFSVSGKRKGEEDPRHVWPAMFSLIKKHRPNFVAAENVIGHISMGIDTVLSDLASEGYAVGLFVLPACSASANHRRDRTWILAIREGEWSERQREIFKSVAETLREFASSVLKNGSADADSINVQGHIGQEHDKAIRPEPRERQTGLQNPLDRRQWAVKPRVRGIINGVPATVDANTCRNRPARVKALGNTVMPQIVQIIGGAILELFPPQEFI